MNAGQFSKRHCRLVIDNARGLQALLTHKRAELLPLVNVEPPGVHEAVGDQVGQTSCQSGSPVAREIRHGNGRHVRGMNRQTK